jgi:hypothetical protein
MKKSIRVLLYLAAFVGMCILLITLWSKISGGTFSWGPCVIGIVLLLPYLIMKNYDDYQKKQTKE